MAQAATRAPYIPDHPDLVLQRVPPTTDPRVRRFDQLKNKLAQDPKNRQRALALARAYLDYGRATGDARYLGRSLAVIDPWMSSNPPPIPVLLIHAIILQSRHYFQASRQELAQILEREPGNVQARLTLATVAMVQGDYDLGNQSCVALAAAGGNFMGTACTAALRSFTGHAEQAYALLSLIADPGPEAPAAIKSWLEGLMADTAVRMGKADKAERHFKRALQLTPGDNFLLADYGDFLLDQGRPRAVVDLVKNYTESDTSFLRLVFAETALGMSRAHADTDAMAARFRAMDRRGSRVFRREQARFVLYLQHNPQRALTLAKENWTVQRAPKDARVYLEAALAAGKPGAAQPVLTFLAGSRLQDPHVAALVRQAQTALNRAGANQPRANNRP